MDDSRYATLYADLVSRLLSTMRVHEMASLRAQELEGFYLGGLPVLLEGLRAVNADMISTAQRIRAAAESVSAAEVSAELVSDAELLLERVDALTGLDAEFNSILSGYGPKSVVESEMVRNTDTVVALKAIIDSFLRAVLKLSLHKQADSGDATMTPSRIDALIRKRYARGAMAVIDGLKDAGIRIAMDERQRRIYKDANRERNALAHEFVSVDVDASGNITVKQASQPALESNVYESMIAAFFLPVEAAHSAICADWPFSEEHARLMDEIAVWLAEQTGLLADE